MYKDDTATRNPVKDAIDILPENIRESIFAVLMRLSTTSPSLVLWENRGR
jgi:hypothetical protein